MCRIWTLVSCTTTCKDWALISCPVQEERAAKEAAASHYRMQL